jgi:hypothetical protein
MRPKDGDISQNPAEIEPIPVNSAAFDHNSGQFGRRPYQRLGFGPGSGSLTAGGDHKSLMSGSGSSTPSDTASA